MPPCPLPPASEWRSQISLLCLNLEGGARVAPSPSGLQIGPPFFMQVFRVPWPLVGGAPSSGARIDIGPKGHPALRRSRTAATSAPQLARPLREPFPPPRRALAHGRGPSRAFVEFLAPPFLGEAPYPEGPTFVSAREPGGPHPPGSLPGGPRCLSPPRPPSADERSNRAPPLFRALSPAERSRPLPRPAKVEPVRCISNRLPFPHTRPKKHPWGRPRACLNRATSTAGRGPPANGPPWLELPLVGGPRKNPRKMWFCWAPLPFSGFNGSGRGVPLSDTHVPAGPFF